MRSDSNRAGLGLSLALFCALFGCSEGFGAPSRLEGLRVLAVRSDPASGAPGREISLQLLHVDASSTSEAGAPPLQIVWLGGCHNPPSRQYFACLPRLRELARLLAPDMSNTDTSALPPGIFGTGTSFNFTVPDGILDEAPRIETDPVHFGVSYVFFAACRGQLRARPELLDRLPLDCIDPRTGAQVDSSGFVHGFSTLFSYEGLENRNPILSGLALDGVPVVSQSCQADADCASIAAAQDRFEFACSASATCAPLLAPCRDRCPSLGLAPAVDPISAESVDDGTEILWANYYSAAGSFQTPTQLVSDRKAGLISNPSGRWSPPGVPLDPVRLWVTLHDQRGGADWASLDVIVRD